MDEEWVASQVGDSEVDKKPVDVPGRPEAFAGAETVRYETQFEDPRDPDDDIVLLELSGLYAHTTIEVTGERLDGDWPVEHDRYFEPLRIPFRPYDDNKLVVTCRAPQDRYGGLYETDAVPTEQSVPGIWWNVSLDPRSLPTIQHLDVAAEATDDGGLLRTEATVLADVPLSDRVTYSVRTTGESNTRGMMERERVETDEAGHHVVTHDIEIRDLARWWPRDLGRQHRYTVRAKLGEETHTATTGFCSAAVEDGQFRINGEPLNVRGVNLVTTSPADVERALEINANLVRAHAHVLPPSVYEACDENGLLVWQDLPLTGPGAFDTDRGAALAEALSESCRPHPSVVAFGVHDDPTDRFSDSLGSGLFDRLRFQWRAWRTTYDSKPAETVAEAFPGDHPVFPVVGGPGVESQVGSYYPGWDYGVPADIESLLDRYPVDIVAEYGAGSFDSAKHRRHATDNPAESQAYQGDLLQTVTEALRRSETGAIAYAIRDTDDAGMGVYDRSGAPKASKERLARAFAPLQAFLTDPGPGPSQVVVVNDTPSDYAPTLEWTAGEEEGRLELSVGAHGQWTGGPVSLPADPEATRLTLRIDEYEITNRYEF